MKFGEPRNRKKPLRPSEVLIKPETESEVVFKLHDFFTEDEWNQLIPELTKFDADEDAVQNYEARAFLDVALALRILDEKKLQELRDHSVAKRIIKGYLRETEPEDQPEDWQSLNAIAVWLWPEFGQIPEVKDQLAKFKRSAEKKSNRKPIDYLHASEMVNLYPERKNQLGITEEFVNQMNGAISISVPEGSYYIHHTARRDFTIAMLFPPERFAEEPFHVTRRWVKKGIEDARSCGQKPSINERRLNLMAVAWLRLLLRQDVSFSNDHITVNDRKPLGKQSKLPERSSE